MAHNYITPVANPHSPRKLPIMLLIIGGSLAIIIGIVMLLLSASKTPVSDITRLNARVATLQKMIESGKKNITIPDLKKVTTDASILLVGDAQQLLTRSTALGVNGKDKAIIAAEADSDTLDKLETAAVNGQFDDTYRPIFRGKLESTLSLIRSIKAKTKDQSYTEALTKTDTDLTGILSALTKPTS